jgi:SpoVK/Ycf46/Vps4 family AAA+-type ATPase
MDFADLQQVIYKEEIDDTHIIPQDQRIIVFEDIDALGDVVKERASAAGTGTSAAGSASSEGTCTSSEGTGTGKSSEGTSPTTGRVSPSEIHESKLMSEFLKAANKTKNNNLSYLLNMLDGIHECSGRIIIMTTNKVEVLDKALIRPGRIDIKLHFQRCTRYDIKRMIEKFWDIEIDEESLKPELEYKYTSAEVINQFRSTDDFETIREIFIKN